MIVDNFIFFIIEQVGGLVDVAADNVAFSSSVSCLVFVVTAAVRIFASQLDRAASVVGVGYRPEP